MCVYLFFSSSAGYSSLSGSASTDEAYFETLVRALAQNEDEEEDRYDGSADLVELFRKWDVVLEVRAGFFKSLFGLINRHGRQSRPSGRT